jgi:hypothetical protein
MFPISPMPAAGPDSVILVDFIQINYVVRRVYADTEGFLNKGNMGRVK